MAEYTFAEATFDGDVAAAFAGDPFNVGSLASGTLAEALSALRRAEKQATENENKPQPDSFTVSVDRSDAGWNVTFGTGA